MSLCQGQRFRNNLPVSLFFKTDTYVHSHHLPRIGVAKQPFKPDTDEKLKLECQVLDDFLKLKTKVPYTDQI